MLLLSPTRLSHRQASSSRRETAPLWLSQSDNIPSWALTLNLLHLPLPSWKLGKQGYQQRKMGTNADPWRGPHSPSLEKGGGWVLFPMWVIGDGGGDSGRQTTPYP